MKKTLIVAGIRFCPNCGTPIEPEYKFCPNCGSPVRATAPPRVREFTLWDLPRSSQTRVGERFTVHMWGVSKEFVFDGSKGRVFKKVPLEEALRLFSMFPRRYPEVIPRKKFYPLVFQVKGKTFEDGILRIVLLKDGLYDLKGTFTPKIYRASLISVKMTLASGVDYAAASEAIRRFYTEPKLLKNFFEAKERWVQGQELREGKYIMKMPCVIPIYSGYEVSDYIPSALYLTRDGLDLWPGIEYGERLPDDIQRVPFEPMKVKRTVIPIPIFAIERMKVSVSRELCHLPFEAVKKAKIHRKDGRMELKYVDPRGKKKDIEFIFLIDEDVPKFCEAITPYLADRLKIK